MTKPISFRLSEQTVERLKRASQQTMIPQTKLVEQAIKEYLEKLEKRE